MKFLGVSQFYGDHLLISILPAIVYLDTRRALGRTHIPDNDKTLHSYRGCIGWVGAVYPVKICLKAMDYRAEFCTSTVSYGICAHGRIYRKFSTTWVVRILS